MTKLLGTALALVMCLTMLPSQAQARDAEDCMLYWGQAVRSYLTANRTKGPEDETFKPACEIEAKGDKPKARLEAITIGARALAALDMKGCKRFMEYYVGATLPGKLCEATKGQDVEALKKLIDDSIPPPPKTK